MDVLPRSGLPVRPLSRPGLYVRLQLPRPDGHVPSISDDRMRSEAVAKVERATPSATRRRRTSREMDDITRRRAAEGVVNKRRRRGGLQWFEGTDELVGRRHGRRGVFLCPACKPRAGPGRAGPGWAGPSAVQLRSIRRRQHAMSHHAARARHAGLDLIRRRARLDVRPRPPPRLCRGLGAPPTDRRRGVRTAVGIPRRGTEHRAGRAPAIDHAGSRAGQMRRSLPWRPRGVQLSGLR